RLVLLALTLVFTFGATSAATPTPTLSTPSMGGAILRMIGALLFVLALFIATAWFFRNSYRFKNPSGTSRKLQVLEAKTLGPRQSLYVVGYEQQRLLIG